MQPNLKNLLALFFSIFIYSVPDAQLPQNVYDALPDSVKPKDINNVGFGEVIKIGQAITLNNKLYSDAKPFFYNMYGKARQIENKEQRLKIKNGLSNVLYNILVVQYSTGFCDSLENIFDDIIKDINKDTRFEKYELQVDWQKANIYFYNKGNREKALELNKVAWATAKRNNDSLNMYYSAQLFSDVYGELQLIDEAKSWAILADRYMLKIPQYYNYLKPLFLLQMTGFYMHMANADTTNKIFYNNNLDSAALYLREFEDLKYPSEKWGYSYYIKLAEFNYIKGDYNVAKKQVDTAFMPQYVNGTEFHSSLSSFDQQLKAIIYYKAGFKNEAINIAKAQTEEDISFADFWDILYMDALERKDWKQALFYYKKKVEKINEEDRNNAKAKIFEITEGFNVKDKERTIYQLETQNRYSRSRWTYSIVIGSLLFLLAGALLWINNRNKRLKQVAYDAQVKELENIILEQQSSLHEAKTKSVTERKSIGRNLHDGLSGSIAMLRYVIDDYKSAAENDIERNKWQQVHEEVASIYKEARDYSHRLSKDDVREQEQYDIPAYIVALKEKFKKVGIMDIHNDSANVNWNAITPEHSKNIFWILKECFTNAVKHAKAKNIWLYCKQQGKSLQIIFKDDGEGFAKEDSLNGMGLQHIEKSVTMLQGQWQRLSNRTGTEFKFLFPNIILEIYL